MKKKIFIYALVLIMVFTLAVNLGAVDIPFTTVWKVALNKATNLEVFTRNWSKGMEVIIWKIRFPRAILGFITGGALALVGVFMQAVTKNPLSDPYILGISSGSAAGAITAMFFNLGGFSVEGGAFLGAFLATVIVIRLTRGDYSSGRLVLTGIAVSAVFSSLINLLIYWVKNDSKVRNAMFWMTGSLGGAQWNKLLFSGVILLLAVIIGLCLSKELDLLLLGEEEARILGIETEKLKLFLIILSSLLTSSVVALTGTIGFVGMIIPHITRRVTGASHRELIPLSVIFGGIFIMGADTVSRIIFIPEELPIGILTSALGGPFFLWIIKRGYNFGGKRC